ncbi:NAD(P)H-dependent oxidoreductase [Moritella marina ATCC 15381]|uniref:NAD(P)H-dependent oxidoreductase n=1 Tax=Moritella marina ATCC 15381 TaxID=1202962 RepID=A0A5J6WHX5_MORMI|nr:NAD(P)H-dependent oxidoreductase [Moritella marina]QFI36780.1 NAD(P)H-dependent oxidoreductase [Moritella marina ATCC 15381]
MTHQIIQDLSNRYTTKKFDASKKVSPDDLAVIMEAMRLSASSINSQPWKFIVIESDAAKQRMHNTFANKFQFNQPHVMTASHIIIFAHNPAYTRANYEAVIDKGIADLRTKPEDKEAAFGAFAFVELNTGEDGDTSAWTKAQTYLALGNTMHTLARLNIDSTPMEGIDTDLVGKEFAVELDGYVTDVALAIGYRDAENDYNITPPKSRLAMADVIVKL